MSAETRHFDDELQDLLDGRLDGGLRSDVERHLDSCPRCRGAFESLKAARQCLKRAAEVHDVPSDLAMGVARLLDREDQRGTAGGASWLARVPRWGWIAASAVLGLAALAVFVYLQRPSLPEEVARDFRRYRSGALSLETRTAEGPVLESFFAERGIRFTTRVFDLAMMNYQVLGGRTHRLAGRPSAFFVYQGEGGKILVCQMYEGRLVELPLTSDVRVNDDIRFQIYRAGELTLVFWEEGEVTCVLASDIDPEEVVQLAFAKAMKI
jgi:anti-sigma factor RsiW